MSDVTANLVGLSGNVAYKFEEFFFGGGGGHFLVLRAFKLTPASHPKRLLV